MGDSKDAFSALADEATGLYRDHIMGNKIDENRMAVPLNRIEVAKEALEKMAAELNARADQVERAVAIIYELNPRSDED